MKCQACGYEHVPNKKVPYKEAVLYERGKKKGQLKEVKASYVEVPGNEKFYELQTEHDFVASRYETREYSTFETKREYVVSLYVCPSCFTVRTGEI
jgi:hypothetical protein